MGTTRETIVFMEFFTTYLLKTYKNKLINKMVLTFNSKVLGLPLSSQFDSWYLVDVEPLTVSGKSLMLTGSGLLRLEK